MPISRHGGHPPPYDEKAKLPLARIWKDWKHQALFNLDENISTPLTQTSMFVVTKDEVMAYYSLYPLVSCEDETP